jgi:hypothetical protein
VVTTGDVIEAPAVSLQKFCQFAAGHISE